MSSRDTTVQRTILARLPIPELPGWEARTVLLDYPPGASAAQHTHPSAGANYIVEGSVVSQWENGEAKTYTKGEVFYDYADLLHVKVHNPSETERFKAVVTYVIKVDVENAKFVENVAGQGKE